MLNISWEENVILQIIYKPYQDNSIHGKFNKFTENMKIQHSPISSFNCLAPEIFSFDCLITDIFSFDCFTPEIFSFDCLTPEIFSFDCFCNNFIVIINNLRITEILVVLSVDFRWTLCCMSSVFVGFRDTA